MTWNVENFFAPAAGDEAAYGEKVQQLAGVISVAAPDLVGLQEVGDPASFDALLVALGAGWSGVLATHFDPSHAIRVGWLTRGELTAVEEAGGLPRAVGPGEGGGGRTP